MVMMVCFIFILVLFQPFLQSRQFVVEVVEAVDAEVIANATAVGCDGFVMGDAVELEQLLQTGEVGVGDANGLFIR